jgi:capsular polysaccharide biosynthesis protein
VATNEKDLQLELADILSSIRRRWRIGVGMMLLTLAVLGAFYVTRQEVKPQPRYRASVDILVPVRDPKDGTFPEGVPARLFFGQAALATSSDVRGQALVNAKVPESQARGIGFGFAQNEGGIISLTVTAPDSEVATKVATGWSSAYIDARGKAAADGSKHDQDKDYHALQALTTRLENIESTLRGVDPTLLTLGTGTVSSGTGGPPSLRVPANVPLDTALLVYERVSTVSAIDNTRRQWVDDKHDAESPDKHASVVEVHATQNVTPPANSPKTPTLLILGVGLLLALALPVLVDRMDHTIRDAKTASAAFSAPVLSTIPPTRNRYELAKPGTAREGAFRALAAMSVATDRLPRSIVVTSPLGEEQDSIAANFAAALATLGVRVALIGTSPRHAWFSEGAAVESNGKEATTFPQMLELAYAGRLNGDAPTYLQRSSIDNLYVLPPGQRDIDVSTDGLAPMLQALTSASIDVTVIAAPALLQDPNTTIYAWTTRSVMWVMETGEITVEEAREGANRLALAGVTPFGVAMIDQES